MDGKDVTDVTDVTLWTDIVTPPVLHGAFVPPSFMRDEGPSDAEWPTCRTNKACFDLDVAWQTVDVVQVENLCQICHGLEHFVLCVTWLWRQSGGKL